MNGAADAYVDLHVGRAPELIQTRLPPVDNRPIVGGIAIEIDVCGCRQRKGAALSNCPSAAISMRPGNENAPVNTKRCRTSSPEGPWSPGPNARRGLLTRLT